MLEPQENGHLAFKHFEDPDPIAWEEYYLHLHAPKHYQDEFMDPTTTPVPLGLTRSMIASVDQEAVLRAVA